MFGLYERNECPVCHEREVPKVERGSCCTAVRCQACGREFVVVDGQVMEPKKRAA